MLASWICEKYWQSGCVRFWYLGARLLVTKKSWFLAELCWQKNIFLFSHGTHGTHRIPAGCYLFHADGADFRGNRAEQILWSSVSFVWDDNFDKRTKEHIFLLTQRRKVSQSVCVVLRRLRAIIFTRNPRNAQKSFHVLVRIYSYFLSHEWARIFTNAMRDI